MIMLYISILSSHFQMKPTRSPHATTAMPAVAVCVFWCPFLARAGRAKVLSRARVLGRQETKGDSCRRCGTACGGKLSGPLAPLRPDPKPQSGFRREEILGVPKETCVIVSRGAILDFTKELQERYKVCMRMHHAVQMELQMITQRPEIDLGC